MYRFYASPATLAEALQLKAEHGPRARIIAGGTDLLIELERGLRQGPDGEELGMIDLTRIPHLASIIEEDGQIHLGPLVTHNQCVADGRIVQRAFPLARACWEVGAPQIRNRATVAGNIITASPANDSIAPLMALDARITLASHARGERTLSLADFCTGLRQVDMAEDEILTRISFPALQANQTGVFIKLGLRRAQAISVNSIAAVLTWDAARERVDRAAISLGAVAPTIVRAPAAEAYLTGKPLDDATIAEAACLAREAASPIDDVRADAAYRRAMVESLTARSLYQIQTGQERRDWLADPVMLWGKSAGQWPQSMTRSAAPWHKELPTEINGRPVTLAGGMSLLDSLRTAGFVGVKEGCAEGECGACTVFLEDMAVMACMLPSEQAAGCAVTTVEGLGDPEHLHPVQDAFIQSGGVQCGYCTPGFIMSAAKLREERPHPTRGEAAEAFTGNFCRCTGYRKILDAVVQAGANEEAPSPGPSGA